ncbi:hypothetical protein [Thalassomonas actiniarum]|uniref:Uncharacterized protein n=1 Tax=Thalassomonas actiniarum TaxID=485447 RepID=A0AAF0C629_9GAMM|nr:hypothetical protein [Thalassomonas actiniarum]WDE02158.1 hypothetical protein SG35_030855 [Thalassomonas actiniarum]
MKNLIINSICSAALAAFVTSAHADDEKMYPGSMCSFADFPLASHNKMHHRHKNLSGRGQWVTCPIVRDSVLNGVEYLSLDMVGTATNVRFEQRAPGNGSLSGWNSSGLSFVGGGVQYYWFSGNSWASPINRASLNLELYLYNNAYINAYRVKERT